MLTCIVLASGQSKRLGFDKLAYIINNKPVIEYLFDELNKIDFDEIIIVTNNKDVKKPKNYKFVDNPDYELGMSSSIKHGLLNAKHTNDYMFFVGDQPLLKSHIIQKLIQNMKDNKIVLPIVDGVNKNPVIFPNKWRDDLLTLSGDVGGRQIIKSNPKELTKVTFSRDEQHYFFDLDNTCDLKIFEGEFNNEFNQ